MLDFLEELENKRRYSFSDQEILSLKYPETPTKLFFKNETSSSEIQNEETNSFQSEIFPKYNDFSNFKKKKLIKKRKRGNKKDDFDYNKYIQQELKKSNSQNLDNSSKKKLIQKIRNRMSAQRSRLRQKQLLKTLEEENKTLKTQNYSLESKLRKLEEENKFLLSKNFDEKKRKSKNSLCTTDESDLKDTIMSSPEYFRAETPMKNFFLDKKFLFVFFFVGILLCCNNNFGDGVKIGGLGLNFSKNENLKNNFVERFLKNYENENFGVKKRFDGFSRKKEKLVKKNFFGKNKVKNDMVILKRFKMKNKWSFFEKKYLGEKIKMRVNKVENDTIGFRLNKIVLKE